MPIKAPIGRNQITPEMLLGANRRGRYRISLSTASSSGSSSATTPTVRAVITTAVTLDTALTSGQSDGVTLVNGDHILLTAQASGIQNRIAAYSSTGAWTFLDTITYSSGMAVYVQEGTTYKRSTWKLETTGVITAGVTALTWGLDVGTVTAGGITETLIADDAVTDAKLRNSAALSVIGNPTNALASPADIAAGTDGHVLRRSGTSVGFGQVLSAGIASAAVTLAKIDPTGATTGQVITYDGANVIWDDAAAGGGTIEVRAVVTGYDFSGNSEVPNGIRSSAEIDDVSVGAGEKVLVMNETDQTYNDVWVVAAGNWTRSADVIAPGVHLQVMDGGAAFGGAAMYCRNTAAITVGVTNVTFGRVEALPIDNSVSAATIIDGSVGTAELADGAVTSAKIPTSVAGAGLTGGGGSALAVNPDDSTIEISSDVVRVKDGGITPTKLSFDPATQAELDTHAGIVASTTVFGHVKVDGVTVLLNGSSQLQSTGAMIFSTNVKEVVGGGITVAAGATVYIGPGQTSTHATESAAVLHLPRPGVFANLYVRCSGTQPATGSLVITLRIASIDTSVTTTVPANGAAAAYQDTVNTASASVGDDFCFKLTNNAAAGSILIEEINICY